MNLNKINVNIGIVKKWALIGVVLVFAFVINLVSVVNPQVSKIVDANKAISENNAAIKKLNDKQSTKDELLVEKKVFKYKLSELNSILPNCIVPEKFIQSLKGIIVENQLEVSSVDFTKPTELGVAKSEGAGTSASTTAIPTATAQPTTAAAATPTAGLAVTVAELDKKANALIESIFKETQDGEVTGEPIKASELQLSEIKDESPYRVDVNFAFIGDDKQFKSFISRIESSTNKMIINGFSIETGNDGQKQGTVSLSLFGFKDTKLPAYDDPWYTEIPVGGSDLFDSSSSTTFDVNSSTKSDFDITLSPITSDKPSVVLSKHGSIGTDAYGDNKGMEKVEIFLYERSGKFYYKYKTQNSSYPNNGKEQQFTPISLGDIIIKVYSINRQSESDNSGIDLIVHNQTTRNINIVPYGDDVENPRLHPTITN